MMKNSWTLFLSLIFLVGCASQHKPAPTVSKERKFFTPPNWQEPIQAVPQEQAVAQNLKNPDTTATEPVQNLNSTPTSSKENPPTQSSGFNPDFTQKPIETVTETPPREPSSNDGFKPEFAAATGTAAPVGNTAAAHAPHEQMEGYASWYGPGFHGNKTANGEQYNQNQMTAAHRILPMNTWVQVRNLDNDRVVVVRINDRGPYKKNRIIDLTKKAAETLGFKDEGTARVSLKVLQYPKDFDPSKGLEPYKQVVVQIAVFKGEQRAYSFRDQLSQRYQDIPFHIDDNKEAVFQVIAGPYEQRTQALEIAKILKADGIDNFVRSYRK